MTTWRVVNTDNFGGDYPDEQFVGGIFPSKKQAEYFANKLNGPHASLAPRYHKVVKVPYNLTPGFTP